jgi:hypothetical protein
MFPVHDLHLERTQRRVLFRHRAQHIAKIVIVGADVGDVVVKENASAAGNEFLTPLALCSTAQIKNASIERDVGSGEKAGHIRA